MQISTAEESDPLSVATTRLDAASTTPSQTPIRIEVWSDIACPWCYIGKRRLEAGIAAFSAGPGALPVEIEYRSFELAPDTPVDFDGGEIDFLVEHKRLPADRVRAMLAHVTEVAESVGLVYDFGALRHTNTVKAHQLLHFAKARGRQNELKERLLRAYFTEGRHVGREDELAGLAAEVGLDPEEALRSLREDEHLAAVREDESVAAAYGIGGVPFFVLDGKYGISGAQPEDAFAEALTRVATERETEDA